MDREGARGVSSDSVVRANLSTVCPMTCLSYGWQEWRRSERDEMEVNAMRCEKEVEKEVEENRDSDEENEGGGEDAKWRGQQRPTARVNRNSRLLVGQNLVDIFRTAADAGMRIDVNNVMSHVQQVINDPEAQVRSVLVEQLPQVAMICHESPDLFEDVLHRHLLEIIIKFLQDDDSQVRQTAQAALLVLIERELLDKKTIENKVYPVVEFLSFMSEFLSTGISLMSKMAPLIGSELTEKFFLDRYIELCKSQTVFVRKTCATHFGEMCSAVGKKALFDKLFPTFVSLCCDKAWAVRKACVDVMMPVSCHLTIKHRRFKLADLLACRLNDDSKWVRMSAFQILGPYISTFAKEFTGLGYNQYGELVFTSQQGTNSSIRYSNEGLFPSGVEYEKESTSPFRVNHIFKCKTVEDHEKDDEEYWRKKNVNMKKGEEYMTKIYDQIFDCKNSEVEGDIENRLLYGTRRKEIEEYSSEDSEDAREIEKYNQFLYYYIPPELPLNDELVQAVKMSASKTSVDTTGTMESFEKSGDAKTDFGEAISEASAEPPDELARDTSEEHVTNREEKSQVGKEEKDEAKNKSEAETVASYKKDSGISKSEEETNDTLEDTFDISMMSMDKSILEQNIMMTKQLSVEQEIYTQEIVPQILVDFFVSMPKREECSELGADISHHCAFSFPAVTLTLGRENWRCLRKAYQSLAGAKQWKVRRTLASSIHEIAMILGEELTAIDLLPIYDGFIKDLDEVRIGVLKHLATFLKVLKPAERCRYLPRLKDFLATDSEWNWRFREELAAQLIEALTLYSPIGVAGHIVSLSMQLLVDKVAAVRYMALILVTQIVALLSNDEILVTAVLQELTETLAIDTNNWMRRQMYAILCERLISSDAITGEKFSEEMLPSLLKLSWDKVPNVRLAVARTMAQDILAKGSDWLGEQGAEEVEKRLRTMRLDPDQDVRVLAGGEVHPAYGVIDLEQARNFVSQ
ncbi:serine/threonine-protein phosphatase 4 regulatory subunit 1-like isoform X2 [Prorops nasuta]|uniref:serine/threonine-protein phosphatase 4 regulatory subunit 1-like isoform X2 n=1 Tax=Prorops nasuta TaxID=863751 RepID=UPI0034CFE33E